MAAESTSASLSLPMKRLLDYTQEIVSSGFPGHRVRVARS